MGWNWDMGIPFGPEFADHPEVPRSNPAGLPGAGQYQAEDGLPASPLNQAQGKFALPANSRWTDSKSL